MSLRQFTLAALTALLPLSPVHAECIGTNLIDAMPDADRTALYAKANAVPFATGNYWRATRGNEVVTVIGTYHADDPRHDATLTTLMPEIARAKTVLVEAGPEEEKALMDRIAREPGLMIITDGPTLPDLMPEQEWQDLSQAMTDRGIPPFMAAKFQPWYVSVMLSLPGCGMQSLQDGGLDKQVIKAAEDAKVPVRALEPYDTVFGIFGDMTMQDQLAMIRTTLAGEEQSASLSVTLAASYFAQESRLIWEFMHHEALQQKDFPPEQIEAEFARMEEALMNRRNRAWIPVIEKAAADGPVFAAFGALHLSGKDGVLNLLQQQGFALERLPLP